MFNYKYFHLNYIKKCLVPLFEKRVEIDEINYKAKKIHIQNRA